MLRSIQTPRSAHRRAICFSSLLPCFSFSSVSSSSHILRASHRSPSPHSPSAPACALPGSSGRGARSLSAATILAYSASILASSSRVTASSSFPTASPRALPPPPCTGLVPLDGEAPRSSEEPFRCQESPRPALRFDPFEEGRMVRGAFGEEGLRGGG
eukprot:2997394-Rhodomonas_salina.2